MSATSFCPLLRTTLRRVAAAAVLSASAALAAAPGPAPVKRPPITGIATVVLAAQSLNADKAFYTHTLGWAATASPEYPKGLRFSGGPLQTVDVYPATSADERAFDHVAWATTDAEALRQYLASKGVPVPETITVLGNGDKLFRVKDPEGNTVEFLERVPGDNAQAAAPPDSMSGRIIHAGFIVHSAAAEDRFYRDILGFHLYWEGGMKPGPLDWVSMQVPDGTDWLEYMLGSPTPPSRRTISVDDHFSLGIENMDTVVKALEQRGFPAGADQQHKKQEGKDGKYQLNLYDPDAVRIEFMEFKPFEKPCCHAFEGRQPGPNQQ